MKEQQREHLHFQSQEPADQRQALRAAVRADPRGVRGPHAACHHADDPRARRQGGERDRAARRADRQDHRPRQSRAARRRGSVEPAVRRHVAGEARARPGAERRHHRDLDAGAAARQGAAQPGLRHRRPLHQGDRRRRDGLRKEGRRLRPDHDVAEEGERRARGRDDARQGASRLRQAVGRRALHRSGVAVRQGVHEPLPARSSRPTAR